MNQRRLGYCTNVHAGADLAETRRQLQQHACRVRDLFAPAAEMGVGLWLSAATARDLLDGDELQQFSDWLRSQRLLPFTLNGFPYGNFHQKVVKHDVYLPTWADDDRLGYTRNLIHILDRILPSNEEGSISTLPLCWGTPPPSDKQLEASAANLRLLAGELARLEADTGRLIYLCIEPEPGCAIQESRQMVEFFRQWLRPGDAENDPIRRHIRVCHDVCHAAVMFEGQYDVLQAYRREGIGVGKVQVSSAICLPGLSGSLESADSGTTRRAEALAALGEFAEDRYLHQTVCRSQNSQFFEDLPQALAAARSGQVEAWAEWRVHFHVPIYLERFGALSTTREDIVECLRHTLTEPQLKHYEVETYAWGVLPEELRQTELASGIAREMQWLHDQLTTLDQQA